MNEENKIKNSEDKEDLNFLMKTLKIARENPDKTINKAVGSIIVKDGEIIGKGYRITYIMQKEPYKDITFHAEHVAITNAGEKANGATLYTTLEPCTKRSKGPGWDAPNPCCKIIHEAGIKKVVIGIFDEDFGHGGAKYLIDKGVEVIKIKNLDEKQFKDLVDNPYIKDEKVRKLQEETRKNLSEK